jgi:hypothetical protein
MVGPGVFPQEPGAAPAVAEEEPPTPQQPLVAPEDGDPEDPEDGDPAAPEEGDPEDPDGVPEDPDGDPAE